MKLMSLLFSNCYFFASVLPLVRSLRRFDRVWVCDWMLWASCDRPGPPLPLWDKAMSKSLTLSWFLCPTFNSNLCFLLAENAQSELLRWKMWVYFYLFRVLWVAVGLQGRCSAKLPTTPFQSSLPYMVVASCRLQAVQHYQQCSLTCFCHPLFSAWDCSPWPCLKGKYLYLPPVGLLWRPGFVHGRHQNRNKRASESKGCVHFVVYLQRGKQNRPLLLAKLIC